MSKTNPYELLNTPDWMNKEFFTKVLKKSEKDDGISIKNLFITRRCSNNNHDGATFQAIITYNPSNSKEQSKSLILVTTLESDEPKTDLFSSLSFVWKPDISICSTMLPKLKEELRKIGEYNNLGARVLYYSLEPRECIVFENNVPNGYEVMRMRSCNMEEVKAVFLKLAKWHAVSYKIAAENTTADMGAYFKSIEEMPLVIPKIKKFIDKLETLDESKKAILKMSITSLKLFTPNNKSPSKGIFVLCHGKLNRENIVFKHNSSGQLQDVMLVNLHDCFFGPTMLDVVYLKYTLMDSNIRSNYYDEIIHYYSLNFIETLKKLQFQGEIPKVSDFYNDIMRIQYPELFHMKEVIIPMWHALAVGDRNDEDIKVIEAAIENEMKTLVPTIYGIN